LSDPDIDVALRRLRTAGASLVAVSGHDSTPYTMGRFAAAFGPGFREVQVGEEIRVDGRSQRGVRASSDSGGGVAC
jgi:hypothetical protein